jgi:hypothetical protein
LRQCAKPVTLTAEQNTAPCINQREDQCIDNCSSHIPALNTNGLWNKAVNQNTALLKNECQKQDAALAEKNSCNGTWAARGCQLTKKVLMVKGGFLTILFPHNRFISIKIGNSTAFYEFMKKPLYCAANK